MTNNQEDKEIKPNKQDVSEEHETIIEETVDDEGEVPTDRAEPTLEEITAEREQFKALLQRVQADFLNYKKRVAEEQQGVLKRASITMLLKFLPVLDDFANAFIQIDSTTDEDQSWLEGNMISVHKLLA